MHGGNLPENFAIFKQMIPIPDKTTVKKFENDPADNAPLIYLLSVQKCLIRRI